MGIKHMVIYKKCHEPVTVYLLFSPCTQSRGSEGKKGMAEEEEAG